MRQKARNRSWHTPLIIVCDRYPSVGSGYRGRFFNAQDLLDDLYTSLADRSSPKVIKSLARYDLLVIDEVGYLTLNAE